MIKYLGSKRRLVPVLGSLLQASGARTALDLFTGTTRVAQEFKRRGAHVIAVDLATYSEVFGRCWIEADADGFDHDGLADALRYLNGLRGRAGYFTEAFCIRARYVQPFNGERIDAIRDAIESDYRGTDLYPVLLTSLILAADRVDSTTGLQMAYLKAWSERSYKPVQLTAPTLIPGTGRAIRGDALDLVGELAAVDLAYVDPPYNQHRYFTNYHVWETLVRWDAPEPYGIAMKRIDSRDDATRSVFNSRRQMPVALQRIVDDLQCQVLVLSYNNESWLTREELIDMCRARGAVEVLDFDSRRYVGAQIGVHNPAGDRVGVVGSLRNVEHLVIAGERTMVSRMAAQAGRLPLPSPVAAGAGRARAVRSAR
ncbi:MAG: DNA adenine methylase [Actinomycetales bacterium]|nr:DNA adenine methylase [Actinomycetales bacterium]